MYSLDLSMISEKFLDAHPGVKMIVFDFDRTLTKEHALIKVGDTTRSRFQRPVTRAEMYQFASDPEFIRVFIDVARRRGVNVAIASFNDSRIYQVESRDLTGYALIKTFLDSFLDHDLFSRKNIIAYQPQNPYKVGKSPHIKVLSSRYHLLPEEIMLFDDNKYNVFRALDYAHHAYLVPISTGFTRSFIQKLIAP